MRRLFVRVVGVVPATTEIPFVFALDWRQSRRPFENAKITERKTATGTLRAQTIRSNVVPKLQNGVRHNDGF